MKSHTEDLTFNAKKIASRHITPQVAVMLQHRSGRPASRRKDRSDVCQQGTLPTMPAPPFQSCTHADTTFTCLAGRGTAGLMAANKQRWHLGADRPTCGGDRERRKSNA